MKKFKAEVVVFVHAPTRKYAMELIEHIARQVTADGKYSSRCVASSDDTGENWEDLRPKETP